MPDSVAFFVFAFIFNFIVMVFFLGDILMSARLIIIGVFAIIDRLRTPHRQASPRIQAAGRRSGSRLQRGEGDRADHPLGDDVDYENIRIIVIDDGSKDRTAEVAREAYAADIACGRVTC